MTTDHTEKRRCIVCQRRELDVPASELQTCPLCVGRTRRDLLEVVELYALLPGEIAGRAGAATPLEPTGVRGDDEPMLGGDALVLLAWGSTTTIAARPSALNPEGDRSHAVDNDDETPSVLATLVSWEDDWRSYLRLTPAGWAKDARGIEGDHRHAAPPTVSGTADFLLRGLSQMAQRHPAFDEFAADMRQLRSRLELVTKSADAIERAAVACPDCGDRLRKEWAKPARCQHDGPHCDHSHRSPSEWPCRGSNTCGCDQGGARDEWVCRNRECGRIVEEAEYWLAVRQHLEQPEAS